MQDTDFYYTGGDDEGIVALKKAYREAVNGLGFYFQQTERGYRDRRCDWDGKSQDLRKHGKDAFPWDGASDNEVPLIDEKISAYVSIMMASLRRANIRANPRDLGDAKKARAMSAFYKYIRDSYVPNFFQKAERAANYWLEKGLMVTYVGWEYQDRRTLKTVTFKEIAEQHPDVAELIADETMEAEAATVLQAAMPDLKRGRARRAIRQLRVNGAAEIPMKRREINRPLVESCAPDSDVLFPPWCIDPQRSPYFFWKSFMTAQEIEGKVETAGWDKDWAKNAIENLRGVDTTRLVRENGGDRSLGSVAYTENQADLVEVVHAYRRLIDPEDGAEGIYCTVFAARDGDTAHGTPPFAKHELMGMEEYPLVVTRLTEDQKRLYDLNTFPDKFRGTQDQVKTGRDSRADRASFTTLPAMWHRAGRRPKEIGPGARIPVTREGEFGWAPIPDGDPSSMEIEATLIKQSDRVVGLDADDPDSAVKKQFFVDKFLEHHSKVLRLCEKQHRIYGDQRLTFRVAGIPEVIEYQTDQFGPETDVYVEYDVLNFDPETVDKKLDRLAGIAMMDKYGKIDQESLIEVAVSSVDPVMADAILRSKEQSTQKILEDVTNRLTAAYAGIDMGAGQGGAEIAMQAISSYVQQPDIAARLQQDEAFRQRVENIAKQYQFQIIQSQNAEIGRTGGTPATFDGVQS